MVNDQLIIWLKKTYLQIVYNWLELIIENQLKYLKKIYVTTIWKKYDFEFSNDF